MGFFKNLFGGGGGDEGATEILRQQRRIERKKEIADETIRLTREATESRNRYFQLIGKRQRKKRFMRKRVATPSRRAVGRYGNPRGEGVGR